MKNDTELLFWLVFIGLILSILGKTARKGIGAIVEGMVTIALLACGGMWVGNLLLGRPMGVTPNWLGLILFIFLLGFLIKKVQDGSGD